MDDRDHTEEPQPKLTSSEQEEWAVNTLRARAEGEAEISQEELADELADQRREREHYKDIDEAHAELKLRQRDREDEQRYEQQQQQRQEAARREQEHRDAAAHRQIAENLQPAQQQYQERLEDFKGRVAALAKIEDEGARQAMERTLQAEAQQLGATAQMLKQGGLVQTQKRLFDSRPGLKNAQTRNGFINWATRKYVISRQEAESVTDPRLIASAYDQWQAEMRGNQAPQAAPSAPSQEPVRHERKHQRVGVPPRQSLAEAERSLARSGSMSDAMEVLRMRELERKEN